MSNADKRAPVGALFTEAYSEGAEPIPDSDTFRRRIGAYINHDLFKDHWELSVYLKKEMGQSAETFSGGNAVYHRFDQYPLSLPRDQMLNMITHVWRFLDFKHKKYVQLGPGKFEFQSKPAENWLAFVRRVLREENLGYAVDDRCGLRFQVDEQFESQREATLSCLADKKFAAALAAFEDSHRHFSEVPSDLKAALRSLFESVEIVAKLMFAADRLTSRLVSGDVKKRILAAHPTDPVAQRAIGRVIDGFADWVDGMHHYRHGQGAEEPVAPPRSFAIYAISSGAAFIRWLVQVDKDSKVSMPDTPGS